MVGKMIFFFKQPGGQDIFSPSKCSEGYFFPSSFLCSIFFPQKRVTCLHIQNVLTFIAVFFKPGQREFYLF